MIKTILRKTAWGTVALGLFAIPFVMLHWGYLNSDSFLKLASLFVSWPVAILIIALVVSSRFQASIDIFLRNISAVSFPGGNIQLQTQVAGSGDAKKGEPRDAIRLTKEQSEEIAKFINELRGDLELASKEKRDLVQEVISALRQSYEWKFAYLNVFYVSNTKNVLLWFSRSSPQTKQLYHQHWQLSIPDMDQRNIMLDVLVQYGMLQSDGINYQITSQGYAFLQYIGLIPPAPTQACT